MKRKDKDKDSPVADSEAIRLPTLKELIGYPTTFDYTVTAPSVLSHLPRFDVDNDISRQTVEELELGGANDLLDLRSQLTSDREKELAEEFGDTWLQQASKSKVRSRATQSKDNSEEQASVTNAVQEDEKKSKQTSTTIYLKPTTMRGIPLASLTPSPVMHGFYVTKRNNELSSSTWTESSTSSYDSIEQQTETDSILDISTTDEVVTVTHDDQSGSESSTIDDHANNIVNNEDEDTREAKFTTFGFSTISLKDFDSVKNTADYEETEETKETMTPVDDATLKTGKSLRGFGRGATSLPNAPVVSPTTPTRRAIVLAVNKYNELTTPLWTGRRIVTKKRLRTTASPIRDAIRRTEDGFLRNTASVFRNSFVTSAIPSMPITTWKPPVTSTVPVGAPTMAPELAISSATSDMYENLIGSTAETEDLRSRATTEATMTLTTDSSIAESDPSIASTSGNFVEGLTFRITEDPATLTTPASAGITKDSPAITIPRSDSTITTTFAEDEITFANVNYTMTAADSTTAISNDSTTIIAGETPDSTTANYLAVTIPAITSTHAMEANFASVGYESTSSTILDHLATNDMPGITDSIITTYKSAAANITVESTSTNHPTTAIQETTSVYEVMNDTEPAIITETASTEAETTSTIANYPANTILTTIQEEPSTTIAPETTTWITPTEIASATVSISTVANYSANATPTSMQEEPSTIIPETTTTWTTKVMSAAASTTDTDSTTTYVITTTASAAAIIPATTDLANAVTASANTSVASSTVDSSWTTTDLKSSLETSSEPPVTNAESISTTESSTISFAAPTIRDIDIDVTVPDVTKTKESAYTTEIPVTFETYPKSTVTTAIPISFANTDSGTSTATTAQTKTFETPTATLASSTRAPIANTATIALRESTILPSTPATFHESVATNVILQTTTRSTYETSSARTTSEEPRPELKTVSENTAARPVQNRTRGRTRFNLAAIDYEFGRRTSGRTVVHRRVINRPSNGDVETSTTKPSIRQYPRRRITVYRDRPREPYSKMVEKNHRRRIVQKRLRTSSKTTSNIVRSDEKVVEAQNNAEEHITHDRVKNVRKRMKVLKRVRERIEKEETSTSPAGETMILEESSNLGKDETLQAYNENTKIGRRRKIVLKRLKPQSQPGGGFKKKEPNGDTDSSDRSSSDKSQSILHTSGDIDKMEKMKIKMEVVLKKLKSESEERNSTTRRVHVDSDFNDKNLSHTPPTNLRASNSLPDEGNTKRRMKVVLKSIKPVFKKRNATEEANANSDVTDNLRGDFSNGVRTGKSFVGERIGRRMRVLLKSVRPKPERGNTASEDSDSAGDDLQGNFSNNLYMSDILPNGEEKTTRSESGEEETTTAEPKAEPRTTEATSVRVDKDTDRPSHEVNTWTIDGVGSISRKSAITGRITRQRISTTTHLTTTAPLTNTVPSASTTHQRRSRPFAESTLSSRIDLVDPYEFTEQTYVRPTGVEVDQRADVSDQSIRAQEFAVTLADPPSSSSSGTGRTQLRNAVRRKISTTVAPRIDPTPASRTVSKYDGVSRSRQGSKAKDRLTVNATTRPRRPPVVDYDYYEDEVPVVAGKALLNSKLFLTSKGMIRCLDQGNFPHPYSCKKFITCARMVNGQVIGTEYTCPAKLSFDPVGGICNWSAGLGCKD